MYRSDRPRSPRRNLARSAVVSASPETYCILSTSMAQPETSQAVSAVHKLAIDDPCTIIEPNGAGRGGAGRTLVVYVTEMGTPPSGYVHFAQSRIQRRYPRKPEDEGVTWIRGHHAVDSPEVLALLAAGALATEPLVFTNAGTSSVHNYNVSGGAKAARTQGVGAGPSVQPVGQFTTRSKP